MIAEIKADALGHATRLLLLAGFLATAQRVYEANPVPFAFFALWCVFQVPLVIGVDWLMGLLWELFERL